MHADCMYDATPGHTLTVCSLPLNPDRSSFASSTGSATVRSTATSRLLDLRLRDGAMLAMCCDAVRCAALHWILPMLPYFFLLCVTSAALHASAPCSPCVFGWSSGKPLGTGRRGEKGNGEKLRTAIAPRADHYCIRQYKLRYRRMPCVYILHQT